jgi:hypothetical protein
MKVYYFNDEKIPITIQVNSCSSKGYSTDYVRLKPLEGKVIEFDAPEGSIPYIKRWETRQILVSYLRADSELLLSHHNEPSDPVSGAV